MPVKVNIHIIKISVVITCFFLVCCNKTDPAPDYVPATYDEMFAALNLKFDVTYNYVERINNFETGNKGSIKFSLFDTSMTETFNSITTKDHFRLDSMKAYSAKFESFGFSKYNASQSVFINSARQTISFVENQTMVSFGVTTNGSYYFHQYILSK